MSAASTLPKKAEDHIPYCKDQGLPFLAAAAKAGVSIQAKTFIQTAGGVFDFAAEGLEPMADGAYAVLMHNHSGLDEAGVAGPIADYPTADPGNRTPAQFVIAGPPPGDVIDVVIVGRLRGQI